MLIIKGLMLAIEQIKLLKRELIFKTSRSGGKGGQNVNKVETKVEISFNIYDSEALSEDQKSRINYRLRNKITDDGFLKLYESKNRSQLINKQVVVDRFLELITNALKPTIKRKATKPSKSSQAKRIDHKKRRGEIKIQRKKLR